MDPIAALLAAIRLARDGRHPAAELAALAILQTDPDQPNALFLLGECLLATARPAEAVIPLAHNLHLRPSHRDGRLALARAQLAADQPAGALTTLDPLATGPALTLRGTALNALGRPAEAIAAFAQALAANPADAEAELNMGNAYADLDATGLAEHHIRRAIALRPDLAEAHASLGHVLATAGRVAESVAAANVAIALRPDFAAAHWNAGIALLLGGDMAAGLLEYEWRKRHFAHSFTTLPTPEWQGEPLDRRTILVLAEQGLGDTIQFARYLPLLAARGARVAVVCAGSLVRLLGGLPGIAAHAYGEQPGHDCWVDQMSLPRLFGTTLATVPDPAGYLRADPARTREWDRLLPTGLRVGLVWAGNPLHSNDRRRSMPVDALAPILAVPGCAFISLQVGKAAGTLPGVLDPYSRLDDWTATAALVGALDLVITVDTAVAHLSGAMGVPTWLMLPHAPDWRWLLGRDDTPWYAAMRLFRQGSPGDWAGVVQRAAAALAEAQRSSG
jgi:tetratricopeptide (TPR) repeat protein